MKKIKLNEWNLVGRSVWSFFGKYPSLLMTRDLGPPRVNCWTGSSSSCPIGGHYMNQFVHKSHKVP